MERACLCRSTSYLIGTAPIKYEVDRQRQVPIRPCVLCCRNEPATDEWHERKDELPQTEANDRSVYYANIEPSNGKDETQDRMTGVDVLYTEVERADSSIDASDCVYANVTY